MKKVLLLLTMVSTLLLTGCSSAPRVSRTEAKVEAGIFYNKNYTLNETKTTWVGNPMIKVDGGPKTFRIKPVFLDEKNSNVYMVGTYEGMYEYQGKAYKVLDFTTKFVEESGLIKANENSKINLYGVLVDDKGEMTNHFVKGLRADNVANIETINDSAMLNWVSNINSKIKLKIEEVALGNEETKEIAVSKDYANIEILYSGIANGNTLRLIYREYTANDLARPSFYQELTYGKDDKFIRFKDYYLQVMKADNQSITFKVLNTPYHNSEYSRKMISNQETTATEAFTTGKEKAGTAAAILLLGVGAAAVIHDANKPVK